MSHSRPVPIVQSVKQVDQNSWILGESLLLSRCSPSRPDGHRDEAGPVENTASFSIQEASYPLPPNGSLPPTGTIKLVHEAARRAAVWAIDEVTFLKVKALESQHTTREHVTLAALGKRALSFAIPKVLCHAERDGLYYLVLSRVPGQTLTEAWPQMDEGSRSQCVSRVVQICKELAQWQGQEIVGVDGRHLSDEFLTKSTSKDFTPTSLSQNCAAIGLDCSKLVFYHCDMGPGNLIVDTATKTLSGVIDWETAGFVPQQWIRTKFRISGGLDFPTGNDDASEWRRRVQKELESNGFTDMADEWMMWSNAAHDNNVDDDAPRLPCDAYTSYSL